MTPVTTPLSFVTTTVVDWIDVFTRPQYKDIVVESLRFCQRNKGLNIYSWVLMSNHLHIVASIDQQLHCNDFATYSQLLSNVIRDYKKYTRSQRQKDKGLSFLARGLLLRRHLYNGVPEAEDRLCAFESCKTRNSSLCRGLFIQFGLKLRRNERVARCRSSVLMRS